VLLSIALGTLADRLNDGRPTATVEAGWFAQALIEGRGWVILLGVVAVGGIAVAYRLAIRLEHELIAPPPAIPRVQSIAPPRRTGVGPALAPDAGKFEPEEVPSGAAGPPTGWRGLGRPVVARKSVPPDLAAPERSGISVVEAWLRRAAGDERPVTGSLPFSSAAASNVLDPAATRDRSAPAPGTNPPPAPAGDGADTVRRCPVCSTPIAANLPGCPFCGTLLE
jgi:hypothetical protein